MRTCKIIAQMGWSENGPSLTSALGLLAISVLIGLLSYLVLQRSIEAMIGRTSTSIRELLVYTGIVAALCGLLSIVNGMYQQ